MKKLLLQGALCPLFASALTANAAVVVSNLNETSPGAGGNPLMAMAFTTDASTYTLNSIIAPLGEINFSGSMSVTGYIYTDSGSLPGTMVSNGNLGTVTFDGFSTLDRTFAPTSGNINLAANTTYWFVLDSGGVNGLLWKDTPSTNEDSPSPYSWAISDSRAYYDTTNMVWASSPSIHMFAVDATATSAVPVPASAWLFLSSCAGLAGYRRKHKSVA